MVRRPAAARSAARRPARTASAIQRLRVKSPSRTACQGVTRIRLPAAPTARAHWSASRPRTRGGGPGRARARPSGRGCASAGPGAGSDRTGRRARSHRRPPPGAPARRRAVVRPGRREGGEEDVRGRVTHGVLVALVELEARGAPTARNHGVVVGCRLGWPPGARRSSGVRIPACGTPTRSSSASSRRSRADAGRVVPGEPVRAARQLGDGDSNLFRWPVRDRRAHDRQWSVNRQRKSRTWIRGLPWARGERLGWSVSFLPAEQSDVR